MGSLYCTRSKDGYQYNAPYATVNMYKKPQEYVVGKVSEMKPDGGVCIC